jgi:two-component system, NarL family, invasion response regulator UvrY
MVKVLIADDHALVRKGLQQVIREQAPDMSVSEAADGEQVLTMVHEQDWDALVLDIGMPKRSGLEVLQKLRYEKPSLPVLILSMHSEDQYAIRVLRAGAAGYLSKDAAPEELVVAIRKAVSGGRYVSPALAEKLALGLSGGLDKLPHELLSDREYTVLMKIGEGKSVGEIADELALSVKTVSTYRARVLEKMNLKTNADLIRYSLENNLLH